MSRNVRLVVCINDRLSIGQRSCVGSGILDYIREIRALIESEGLNIPIVERECLGQCEWGPVMRIAPGGKFFTQVDNTTLPIIIDELKSFLAGPDI